jgi:hypothetical protein
VVRDKEGNGTVRKGGIKYDLTAIRISKIFFGLFMVGFMVTMYVSFI